MNVIDAICSREWAIQPQMLRTMLEIANRERSDNIIELLQKRDAQRMENSRFATMRGDVAIVSVHGPVFKYGNLFTEISGAMSLSVLMKDFNAALENPNVKHILLDIDSPGGEANGVAEFANAIYNARSKKNIVAYVGGLGASAGYWIASAAGRIYANETAFLGSIGVVTTYYDDKEKLAKEGVKEIEIVSASSPKKRPDVSTDSGRALIQAHVDALQEIFVETVARNRGVSTEKVLVDFGQGDVLIGAAAVAAGMADGIANLENVIESLTTQTNKGEVIQMSDPKEKLFTAEEITAEMIADQFPQVAEHFRIEGAVEECERIKAIHRLSKPGTEDLVNVAMFDGSTKAGDVAMQIVERDNYRKQAIAKAQAEDAADIPAITGGAEDAEKAEQAAIDAAVVAGLNAKVERQLAARN